MKVSEALEKGKPTLSFEFFPPKTAEKEKHLFEVISQLKEFQPDFVSVTYGAMGTTRERTLFWAKEIKGKFKIEPVAHLTCIAATQKNILAELEALDKMGVNNILALRGDPPEEGVLPRPADGFSYALELVAFIKKYKPSFCIGVAGYPEKHPQAMNFEEDIKHLKEKVAAGAEYIVTQLFFDNRHFFEFKERCQKAGIKVPVIPGIMPITSLKQIKKMTKTCGAIIPAKLLQHLEEHEADRAAVAQIGEEQAIAQCRELLKEKVPGIHFFVLNQAEPISKILSDLGPTFFRQR
jgi:methylenetetrahydrofolate reductase (NADPH)